MTPTSSSARTSTSTRSSGPGCRRPTRALSGAGRRARRTGAEAPSLNLIEIFHDLVARPRCPWTTRSAAGIHFGDFDTDSGQRVYTALVNRLLAAHGIDHLVADTGEDVGRLVETTDRARTDLIDSALTTPDPPGRDKVAHAIALFRGREATAEDKRSAVIALAGVLDGRRELIRVEIGMKDEGALFTHRRRSPAPAHRRLRYCGDAGDRR